MPGGAGLPLVAAVEIPALPRRLAQAAWGRTGKHWPAKRKGASQTATGFLDAIKRAVIQIDQCFPGTPTRLGIANYVHQAGCDIVCPAVLLQLPPINLAREVCDKKAAA